MSVPTNGSEKAAAVGAGDEETNCFEGVVDEHSPRIEQADGTSANPVEEECG